ncbi:transposable element Tcb1 transposase [Trichonephila clavipes]|nr:transposable element Tcb1 transposase [Trichonephila clavipes]
MKTQRSAMSLKRLLPDTGLRVLRTHVPGSSCAAEEFYSDASLEAVDRRAPNNSKNWQWTTEGSLSRQTIDVCVCNELRAWPADWHQVVFSDGSRFNLRDHNGCIRVRCYAGEHCLPECVIERHSGLTPGVMQDNARPHVAKTVRDFCSAQHRQLLPWVCFLPNISPIEHVWDLVGRRIARDPCPAVLKDELFLRLQAIWSFLPQADAQNLFDSMPRRIAALIATRGGYTKY